MPMPSRFRVGLVQMSMSPDAQANLSRAVRSWKKAAVAGSADHLSSRSSSVRPISASEKMLHCLILPSLFRVRLPKRLVRWRRRREWPSWCRCLSADLQVSTIIVPPQLIPMGRLQVLSQDAHSGRSFVFREILFFPGDLGSPPAPRHSERLRRLICWDQWYPEGARISSLLDASVLFYPDRRSDGTPRKGAVWGWHSAMRGVPFSEATRSQMGFMCLCKQVRSRKNES